MYISPSTLESEGGVHPSILTEGGTMEETEEWTDSEVGGGGGGCALGGCGGWPPWLEEAAAAETMAPTEEAEASTSSSIGVRRCCMYSAGIELRAEGRTVRRLLSYMLFWREG